MGDIEWFLLLSAIAAFTIAQHYYQDYKTAKAYELLKLKEDRRALDQKIIKAKEQVIELEHEVIRLREKKLETSIKLREHLEAECGDLDAIANLKLRELEHAKKLLQYEEDVRKAAEKRLGIVEEFLGTEGKNALKAPKISSNSDNAPGGENVATSVESQDEVTSSISNNLSSPIEFFEHPKFFLVNLVNFDIITSVQQFFQGHWFSIIIQLFI